MFDAGTEYDLVYDIYKTKVGDIGVWDGGTYGHTCHIAGPVVNGYVACYGQNQGGSACPGGGAAANIINISIKGFRGAFHPKTYVDPEPTPPEPTPTPTPVSKCTSWTLVWGDTLGAIMKACEGKVEWGEVMNNYARQWRDTTTGKTVFEGWNTGYGVGLVAGHTIERKQYNHNRARPSTRALLYLVFRWIWKRFSNLSSDSPLFEALIV